MKTRFFSILMLVTILISLTGLIFPDSPSYASAGGQQVWYISSSAALEASPGITSGSVTITSTQQVKTSALATTSMTLSSGHWRGRLTLSQPFTGNGVIRIGSDMGFQGSQSINFPTPVNGFDLDIEAGPIEVAQDGALILEFQVLSNPLHIQTGGTNSYIISPPGNQAFPDPNLTITYGLTMSAGSHGYTSPAASATAYDYFANNVVTVTATAESGYHFSGWSGSVTGTVNPTTVSLTGDKTVTANFVSDAPSKVSTSTAISCDNNTSTSGQSVTFTASVTPVSGSSTPGGTLTFKDGSAVLGTGTSIGAGSWTFTTALLAIGAHSITAEYGGDLNFNPSTSNELEHRIVANYVNLVLIPDNQTLMVGDNFDVVIQAGCGSQAVVGIDVYLDFDPTKLAVVDMDNTTIGVQIGGGTTLVDVIRNITDNTTGHIDYSAGLLGGESVTYPSGTFTVATICFRALAAASPGTSLHFSTTGIRKTYVSGDITGTDVTGILGAGTYTVVSGLDIDIAVALQGVSRADSAWIVPLTVKFFTPGASVLSATPIYSFTSTTNKVNGSALIQCEGLQPGVYDISAVSPHTLVNVKRNVTINLSTSGVSLGTLLEGNADNNELINIADFSILSGSYGKSPGDTGYNAMANFDGTGRVNIADFSLLAGNYTRCSPVELP